MNTRESQGRRRPGSRGTACAPITIHESLPPSRRDLPRHTSVRHRRHGRALQPIQTATIATNMTNPPPTTPAPLLHDARQQLDDVRRGLLRVHKALLEDARIRYEREQGRIEGSGALLQLVLNDPWFAWLHPLSGLVVQIDELLAADEPTAVDGEALLNQARSLMRPDEHGEGFARRYHRAIQDVPDVLIAHVALGKHLV
jgi:hypothetical protein